MATARHKTRQRELREARALLRRVQRGEPRAFALLYAAYEGRLYRFCHRLTGDAETASALVQQTFARALADLPDGELAELDVPAYLHATARGLAYERAAASPSPAAGEHEVAAANQRLSPQERAVLALRDLEGRPDAEIARVLGCEESAVPGLVGTARLRLHAELGLPGAVAACPGRLPELSAHADGTLPGERRAELEQHVVRCANCRAALFAMRDATMRYRAMPVPEAPGEVGERITAALGAVGLPMRSSAAAEAIAAGGRQTAVAVAMGALAVVGVGVTIAAAHDDHKNGAKPVPAPRPPELQPSAPAANSSLMSAGIALATPRPHRAPPALHHVRAGARLRAHARPAPKRPSVAERLGLGKSFAPESPPAAPSPAAATPTPTAPAKPKLHRDIPVEVLPPTVPSTAQAAANDPPAPPPAPEPPPPTQTTST